MTRRYNSKDLRSSTSTSRRNGCHAGCQSNPSVPLIEMAQLSESRFGVTFWFCRADNMMQLSSTWFCRNAMAKGETREN